MEANFSKVKENVTTSGVAVEYYLSVHFQFQKMFSQAQ